MRTFVASHSKEPITLKWFDGTYGLRSSLPVAVFDFDGVLCDPIEDFVYKLPEQPQERAMLAKVARHYDIDDILYDVPYLRHLVLQAILYERHVLANAGPLLGLATEMSSARRPFFILTARSGRAAIQRVFSFLDRFALTPQEVFFVGRVAKGRQIRLVRTTMPPQRRVVFFEDTVRHTVNSRRQSIDTVRIDWLDYDKEKACNLLNDSFEWFWHNINSTKAA
jgi:hypothetical protein